MTSPVVVKICGVTLESEIDSLTQIGVDYFGLVVGVQADHAISIEHATSLISYAGRRIHGCIVTTESNVDKLSRLVEDTGTRTLQLAGFISARRVARLRQRFDHTRLTIMQVVHFENSRAAELSYVGAYSDAGVDYLILDRVGGNGALGSTGETIDLDALESFRDSMPCSVPILVAGGVNKDNVRDLMIAAGAVGIDVSTSVRYDHVLNLPKVRALLEALR